MKNFVTSSLISPQLDPEELALDCPLRLGVLASGSGTNFECIVQAIHQGKLKAEIPILIYNNPEASVKERAQRLNVPAKLVNHRHFKQREDLDQAIVEIFRHYQVEWVIMAGWMRIVTHVLLDAYPNHVINIHPSLLPSFKGIKAVEQALAAQVKITGCTVHIASSEVDSGPILLQAAVPVLADDTPETLHARIQVQEHLIFPQAIALAAKGERK
ncbi:phosphoribosylglycinamide formyltransferase [Rippkaea orientalis PCC 8801]|uniref:Phosphoribosylglycinamide formyltransferase n=1 Tax=Rippkaea orientalis (strain PCC 8801 / RF-1) TaxID=41431 RepID=B7K134_RIPO1|nr:phosphoribosylglycinamide formyltransferase [Rippkaea orientalis]ACK65175.1 phosphoribosylglycinamide formyltransferase [Rippkaea orientalis PCC 8801]